jgi:ankyrin repeat protein
VKLANDATLLHVAAEVGDLELAKVLLARGADVKASNGIGRTPLHEAAANNRPAMVEFLLSKGAPVNDNSHLQPLHLAAEQGHNKVVEVLLAKGADLHRPSSYYGLTALTLAAQAGHLDTVRLLLAKGADAKKDVGALHRAALSGQRDVVALLLDKGADIEQLLPNGYHLYYEPFRHQLSILGYFVEKDKNKFKGLEPIVTIRAIHGSQPVAVVGGRPLQTAIVQEQVAVVELLLARGAKVDVRFPDGSTSLHLAAALGNVDVARLLLTKGADVTARNQAGVTPLGVALLRRETDVAALLRQHGAKE